jgi:hypothetical protein
MGGNGRFPHKVHAQLLAFFRAEPLDDLVRSIGTTSVVTDMIYPHELFALLHRRYEYAFKVHVGGSPERLLQFWESFLQTPYGKVVF